MSLVLFGMTLCGIQILVKEMICLQHFYNIFTTNPKWQVVIVKAKK